MDDLKGRSVRGGTVTMAAQGLQLILRLISIPILARLLTPEDFGLIAMVTAVTGFVSMFKDAGLSMATVQRDKITHGQVSTLFWINITLSLVLMLFTAALAPLLAWFYDEPRLVAITLALAATFLFSGIGIQHNALLTRQMRFNLLALIRVIALTASVVSAITAAYLGAGYWSLVIMTATEISIGATLTCYLSGWYPGLPQRGSGIRPMLSFGGKLTGAESMGYFAGGIGNALIGWWWGAAALGLYSQACRILVLVSGQLTPPLQRVALPVLSRLQDRPEEFSRYYLRIANIMAWIGIPASTFLVLTAEDFILVVLGPNWTEAVDTFRMFGPVAGLLPIYYTARWVLISRGLADVAFRLSMYAGILVVLAYAIGVPYGITGVAAAYAIIWCAFIFPFVMWYAFKGTLIHSVAVCRTAMWPVVASFSIVLFAGAVSLLLSDASPIARLLFQFLAAGVGVIVITLRLEQMRNEMVMLIRPLFRTFTHVEHNR